MFTLDLGKMLGDKKAQAQAVGLELAKRAKEKGIKAAVFDRGDFYTMDRLKSFAEGCEKAD